MDRIFIFDVDGTLTPSRLPMTKKFQKFFEQWAIKNRFYLVTGSDLPKLQEQMSGVEIHTYGIFQKKKKMAYGGISLGGLSRRSESKDGPKCH